MKDRNWIEIDISKIVHNIKLAKEYAHCKIMGVVKANCYGLGKDIACYCESYLDSFGVATYQEAIELRDMGIKKPILILGGCIYNQDMIEMCAKESINISLTSISQAREINNLAKSINVILPVYIAVDSGMARWGFSRADQDIFLLDNLNVIGYFSHFVMADSQDDFLSHEQKHMFDEFCRECNACGKDIHIANSSAILRYPEFCRDTARLGIAMYGYKPSDYFDNIDLKPCVKWYARVVSTHRIKAGSGVSYGWDYITKKPTNIATLSIGYADGYSRAMSKGGVVKYKDKYYPLAGRICMDQCMIDTGEDNLEEGEIVEIVGEGLNSVDNIARICGTINYEILTRIGKRVPRYYINH